MPPKPQPREAAAQIGALEIAIAEFFEEGYAYQVNKHEIDETPLDLRSEAVAAMLPQRSQAEGFYLWVRYLAWLDGVLDLAPHLSLARIEAEGLNAFRRGRTQFQRSHPPCHHCGMPNEAEAYSCHHCWKEIKN